MENTKIGEINHCPGKLIVLEGVDGAGTTTQAFLLHQKLLVEGYKAHLTKEPSSGVVGKLIRKIIGGSVSSILSWEDSPDFKAFMALLFSADRIDHFRTEILHRLINGEHVITDRYALSTLVYQVDEEDNITKEWISQLIPDPLHPDITVLLKLDAEKAEERIALRGEKREIYEASIENIRRHAELYEEFSELSYDETEEDFLFLKKQNIVSVDADGSETEVAASVWNAVKEIVER